MAQLNWSAGELAEGLKCYRAEQFFDAHEHWESVWLGLEDPEKKFLQGLIQVTVAFHHFTKKNYRGTQSLLEAALTRLKSIPAPSFAGIDHICLCSDIEEWLRAFKTEEMIFPQRYPRIVYLE